MKHILSLNMHETDKGVVTWRRICVKLPVTCLKLHGVNIPPPPHQHQKKKKADSRFWFSVSNISICHTILCARWRNVKFSFVFKFPCHFTPQPPPPPPSPPPPPLLPNGRAMTFFVIPVTAQLWDGRSEGGGNTHWMIHWNNTGDHTCHFRLLLTVGSS